MSGLFVLRRRDEIFLEKQNTVMPVKISNYISGPSWTGQREEIRINYMTIVKAPATSEYNFQYISDENDKKEITLLSDVLNEVESGSVVNIKGKIIKGETPEIVGKKNLKMLKCAITDSTDVVPITLWEDEIDNIEDRCVYTLHNVSVRIRGHVKSISTSRTTQFGQAELDDDLQELNDSAALELLVEPSDATIEVEAIRSVSIDKYRSCVECLAKFPPGIETKIVKCSRCGHQMRFHACKLVVACKMIVVADDNVVTLTAFSEVVENLLKIVDISPCYDIRLYVISCDVPYLVRVTLFGNKGVFGQTTRVCTS